MSEIKIGKFVLNDRLINDLSQINKRLNKPLNKITIYDCFHLFEENKEVKIIKEDDVKELLDLWLDLYKKYGVSCDIYEVRECINQTIKVYEDILTKRSWNFGSYTLDYFLNTIVKVHYTEILSFTHLMLLINYYLYDERLNVFEKHYVGDDKYAILAKESWDEIEDKMHSCEICEHICGNIRATNSYILLSKINK